jgi:hypothetical protein
LQRKVSCSLPFPDWDHDATVILLGLPAAGAIPELREGLQND